MKFFNLKSSIASIFELPKKFFSRKSYRPKVLKPFEKVSYSKPTQVLAQKKLETVNNQQIDTEKQLSNENEISKQYRSILSRAEQIFPSTAIYDSFKQIVDRELQETNNLIKSEFFVTTFQTLKAMEISPHYEQYLKTVTTDKDYVDFVQILPELSNKYTSYDFVGTEELNNFIKENLKFAPEQNIIVESEPNVETTFTETTETTGTITTNNQQIQTKNVDIKKLDVKPEQKGETKEAGESKATENNETVTQQENQESTTPIQNPELKDEIIKRIREARQQTVDAPEILDQGQEMVQ